MVFLEKSLLTFALDFATLLTNKHISTLLLLTFTSVLLRLVALSQKRSNFCLPKVTSFFIQAAGLAYHHDVVVDIISPFGAVSHHAPACICLRIDAIHHFVMISYGTLCRFHAATSCGFHTRLRRDWDAEDAHQTHGQIRTCETY